MLYLTRSNVALLDMKIADARSTAHEVSRWCIGQYQVSSRKSNKVYWVETFYNRSTGNAGYTCDCQAYSFDRMCWHIGAVILYSRQHRQQSIAA